MAPSLSALHVPSEPALVDGRVVFISALAIGVALAAGLVAQLLTRLIGLITNLAYFGRWSTAFVSPAGNHLGLWAIGVPVVGGILVGFMARYGSKAIRGHGIPEAMEQVLYNQSRIPARITFLKPVSAAIAIGTGGPFGAEGPIIATGGALGSLVGQLIPVSAAERKALLAAGAAAGMAATFGSPVSAVLLAVELLLFEYRPRSLIPVALATATATAVRMAFVGSAPVFAMSDAKQPGGESLIFYILLGAVMGVVSIGVTHAVYAVEDAFEKLPIHWMWWPALGAIAVGVCGIFAPRSLGVGYDNIENIVTGSLAGWTMVSLVAWKFTSWCISLGSGTSGGTLAPLFTIGGGIGSAITAIFVWLAPNVGLDIRIGALVGMAAIFAGASRAMLASVVFAFECTRQPMGLLPLLGGCTAAFMVSCLWMRNSIMTEKIARRGARVLGEYSADFLDQLLARDHALKEVVTLAAESTLGEIRARLHAGEAALKHQGFPIVDGAGLLVGVLTRRDLVEGTADDAKLASLIRRPPVVVYSDSSLRDAADQMTRAGVGRVPVVSRDAPHKLVGILTRSDLLNAHGKRLDESEMGTSRLSRPLPATTAPEPG
ncbi:MAG: chloride channel protein [Deltaproteobacteria bacterium]|nr:chloride channel protein [Deltaproteobacteria bacterium]